MFGYIVPFVPELKIREFELFRTYYCGLCRTLKDRYGKCDVLNYDAVFLYVLSEGFVEDHPQNTVSKCIVHPFRKNNVLKTPAADYAADVNILMAYAKAHDDREDEGGMRSAIQCKVLEKHFAKSKYPLPSGCSKDAGGASAPQRN